MNIEIAKRVMKVDDKITEDELKSIYRHRAIELHPDVNKSPTAQSDFQDLNAAYQFLLKNLNQLKAKPKPQPTCPKIFRTLDGTRIIRIPMGSLKEDDLCVYIMSGSKEYRTIFKQGMNLPTNVRIDGLGEFKLIEEIPTW